MFFFKKTKEAKLNYVVYQNGLIKYQQILKSLAQNQEKIRVLYFFEKTNDEFGQLLKASVIENVDLINAFHHSANSKENLILLEPHPLASVMKKFLGQVNNDSIVTCYIGMDEIFMKIFGSERIVAIMERMGMDEYDSISHNMINSSIERAQLKLDEKLKFPKDIRTSAEEWAKDNDLF